MESPDVVIVGSGIAGGALATVLASAGMQVLTLERQAEFADHVRGEILWPWGVRAARALDLERVFLEAGAQVVPVFDIYDELTPEPLRMEVSDVSPRLPSRSSTPAQPSPPQQLRAKALAPLDIGHRQIEVVNSGGLHRPMLLRSQIGIVRRHAEKRRGRDRSIRTKR